MRKDPLINGSYYHIINRSIAQYQIFNGRNDCLRFVNILDLYRFKEFSYKYSNFLKLNLPTQKAIAADLKACGDKIVKIIAYSLMPTHFHLILGQMYDDGITKYIATVLNSFTRYFNLRHHRKGPLWEGHFKSVLIRSDEQLLHLTRYIHLNSTSAGLVKKPEDWAFSSYYEYLHPAEKFLCDLDGILKISPKRYQNFVNSRISEQKELSKIKRLLLENYTG